MKENETDIISKTRKCGDLQDMSVVVGSFARKILGKKAFAEADIIRNWEYIVGEELAKLTVPLRIDFKKDDRKDGVLHIEVAGGALALELQQQSKMIKDKVNVFFGYEAINRIKIVQNLQLVKNKSFLPSDNLEKKLVTKDEENYIKQQLEGISNQELSTRLEEIGRSLVISNK